MRSWWRGSSPRTTAAPSPLFVQLPHVLSSPGGNAVPSGCVPVTVNVYFPQEKIDSAAGSIEDLVRVEKGGKPTTPPPAKKEDKQGWLPASDPWLALVVPAPAEAQVPDLKVRTPEVMASMVPEGFPVDKLSKPEYKVKVEKDVFIEMRDGVKVAVVPL